MDSARRFLCVFSLILLDKAPLLAVPVCHSKTAADLSEGNIGESAHFPWLGVLRVHLHHGDSLRIALTGLVLVKPKYAIANSDDIAKIPKSVFREDSKAMFIPKSAEPWYCKPKDYTMHPEYEYSTFNTIALVELLLDEDEKVPFDPICWPGYLFNTSNNLFALGFTDEHKFLEKTLYKLDYVKPSLCQEFYDKAGLQEYKMAPMHMQCGFARNNRKDCDWENGMVLASNSSGKWHLIGISLRGPGCSAPARFIDMFPYLPWIESATDLQEINDFDDFRRSNYKTAPVVPQYEPVNSQFAYKYRGDFSSQQPFLINRIDKDAIQINTFHEMYEKEKGDCSRYKNLIYREKTRILDKSSHQVGGATYRISLYDMHMSGYSCVKVKVKGASRNEAKLWYRYVMDPDDTFAHSGLKTPKELLKHYPVYVRELPAASTTSPTTTTTPKPGTNYTRPPGEPWKPGPHLEAQHIIDKINYTGIKNLNILVWFTISGEANLEVEVYGLAYPLWTFGGPDEPTTPKPKKNKTKTKTALYRREFDRSKRPKIRRLHFSYKYPQINRTEKLNSSLRRTKYKPREKDTNKKVKKLDNAKEDSGNVPMIEDVYVSSDNAKVQKHPGVRRLHHSFQSGSIQVKNPYRLQKAILRELERLSQGPSSKNEST